MVYYVTEANIDQVKVSVHQESTVKAHVFFMFL